MKAESSIDKKRFVEPKHTITFIELFDNITFYLTWEMESTNNLWWKLKNVNTYSCTSVALFYFSSPNLYLGAVCDKTSRPYH